MSFELGAGEITLAKEGRRGWCEGGGGVPDGLTLDEVSLQQLGDIAMDLGWR